MRQIFGTALITVACVLPVYSETIKSSEGKSEASTKSSAIKSTITTKIGETARAKLFQTARKLAEAPVLNKTEIEKITGKALGQTAVGLMSSGKQPSDDITSTDVYFDREGKVTVVVLSVQPKLNITEPQVASAFGKPKRSKWSEEVYVQPKGKVYHSDYELKKRNLTFSYANTTPRKLAIINIYDRSK